MKKLIHLLIVGTVLVASAPLVLADPITGSLGIAGSDTFTSTSINFTSPGVVINAAGDLAGFAFQPVTLDSFSFNSSADGKTLFTIVDGNQTLTFDITDITSSGTNSSLGFPNETVAGTGVLTDTVFKHPTDFSPTDGTFTISTNSNGSTTFALDTSPTAPPAVTPEPSSLLLLGTGLLSGAGMLFRKCRILA
jgi:PEP-CTERM motif